MADGIPTEALEAAREALDNVWHNHNGHGWQPAFDSRDLLADAAIAAAAPHLIAEGRRQAARDIRTVDVAMVENLDGDSTRIGLTVAANIAERGHV